MQIYFLEFYQLDALDCSESNTPEPRTNKDTAEQQCRLRTDCYGVAPDASLANAYFQCLRVNGAIVAGQELNRIVSLKLDFSGMNE